MGLPALSPAVPPSPAGCQCPCPLRVHLRRAVASPHDWRLIIRAPPGSLPPPQSPHIARPREKKSTACVEIRTMWIRRLCRINGDVECDADPALGYCVAVPARCPCINPSYTPSLPFVVSLLSLSAEIPPPAGMDLAMRLADDATLAPAASASSVVGRTSMPSPAAPSFTATDLSTRSSRSVSFGLVVSPFWIPCTTWIPHSNRSTLVLRYLKCGIKLFQTSLASVLEGVRRPKLLVALHRHSMRTPTYACPSERVLQSSPGHYNPVFENSRALHNTRRTTQHAPAASTNAEAGPSSGLIRHPRW